MQKAATILALGLAAVACSGGAKQESSQASNASAASNASTTYRVLFETSKGPVTIEVDPALAPNGARRFAELVKAKYFDGARFYRVVPHFVVQWGAASNPSVTKKWDVTIPDDPVKTSNVRGTVVFAATGEPNSRTTHMFVNLGDNANLDAMGFAPVGHVISGMDNVDRIYSGYGEQPDQGSIAAQGNAYLNKQFPRLDYVKTARIQP